MGGDDPLCIDGFLAEIVPRKPGTAVTVFLVKFNFVQYPGIDH